MMIEEAAKAAAAHMGRYIDELTGELNRQTAVVSYLQGERDALKQQAAELTARLAELEAQNGQ